VAVVKANYTKSKGTAKANIRYIEHRPGYAGERIWRTLFNESGRLSREEAYHLIDNAEKAYVFWRIKISPDPVNEDTKRDLSMQEVTEQTMNTLSEQLGKSLSYVAAIHQDHAPHRHIHVLAILPKLSRDEFQQLPNILIKGATLAAGEQRQELDQIRDHRQREQEREDAQWQRQQEKGGVWE